MLNYRLLYRIIIIAVITIAMQTNICVGCASDGGGPIPPPKIPDTSAELTQKTMKPAEFPPAAPKEEVKKPAVPEAEKKPTVTPEEKVEKAPTKARPQQQLFRKPQKDMLKLPDEFMPPEAAPKRDFLSVVKDVLGALFKVLILILLIYLGALAYKKLRQRGIFGRPSGGEHVGEPRNISEAVSSYVRHKLKKGT